MRTFIFTLISSFTVIASASVQSIDCKAQIANFHFEIAQEDLLKGLNVPAGTWDAPGKEDFDVSYFRASVVGFEDDFGYGWPPNTSASVEFSDIAPIKMTVTHWINQGNETYRFTLQKDGLVRFDIAMNDPSKPSGSASSNNTLSVRGVWDGVGPADNPMGITCTRY